MFHVSSQPFQNDRQRFALQEERIRLWVEVEARHTPQGWQPAVGKLLVFGPAMRPPPEGARVVLKVSLRQSRNLNNPGASNRQRYLAAVGVGGQARFRSPGDLVVLAAAEGLPLRERQRQEFRELLKGMRPVPRAIYLSLILNDQGEINPEMRTAFARTGTTHILSIGGLHMGFLAATVFFGLFWLLRRSSWLLLRLNAIKVATLLSVVPVLWYAWLAGGSPATQRSEVMILSYLLLVFLGRPREVVSALVLAALVILCLSPLLLYTLSFQLSFISVVALLYLLPLWLPPRSETPGPAGGRFRKWSRLLGGWGKDALMTSLAASLATAPLVAAAFHQVSILGVVVNLIDIPLMNTLAVPLGLVALLAQILSLTPLAEFFLFLGEIFLVLGYEITAWAARLPGSAVILPTPSWLQIILYFLILIFLFPPRRRAWTWVGAALAAGALALSVAVPRVLHPKVCEITCLDSFTGLDGVVVSPEDRRLVFSAGWRSWPGRGGGALGPLPAYLHWRQFRHLDQVAVLNLSQDNAPQLLTLAQEFHLGGVWFRGEGSEVAAAIELRNLLGDEGRPALSLERGRPPTALGSVEVAYPSLGKGLGVALQITLQGRQVVLLPPMSKAVAKKLSWKPGQAPDVLVLPGDLVEPLLTRVRPQALVIYGSRRPPEEASLPAGLPVRFTQEGAVSISLSAGRRDSAAVAPLRRVSSCARSWG